MMLKEKKIIYLIRGLLGISIFGFVTVLCSCIMMSSRFLSRLYSKEERAFQNGIIRFWANLALSLFSIQLHVEGLENVPKGSCLFLFNHMSFYDIFSMLAALDDFRFGAKIELYRIPFFAGAMKHAGVLPIARDDREKVIEVYHQARERVRRGERFALAPEGSRQDQYELGPFKSGPFIFALETQIPIVPVIITGAFEVMKSGQWIPNLDAPQGNIRIHVLPAISVQGYSFNQRHELMTHVQNLMSQALQNQKSSVFQKTVSVQG